jgi:hypothetical protein
MKPTIAVLAILAVSPFLTAQEVGLELRGSGGGPFVTPAGSVCVPASCAITPQRTLNAPLGSTFGVSVFGGEQQPFLVAVGGPLACQSIPGIVNDFALGAVAAVIGGVLPPAGPFGGLCGGTVSSAQFWHIPIPATLPPGTQFVFQALTVDGSTLQLTFTAPVLLIAG